MTAAKKRPPFQQVTIEYRVQGELDGLTLAPDVDLDPNSPAYSIDGNNVHVVDVPGNLGIIDPDLIGPATQGDRCIPWVFLDSPDGGLAGSAFAVADNSPDDLGVPVPVVQDLRFLTGGLPQFYSDRPTHIPQGSALLVVGYPAGDTKIVRVNIVAPRDAEEFAAILEACCCSGALCPAPPSINVYTIQDPTGIAFFPGQVDINFGGANVGTADAPFTYVWVQTTDNLGEPSSEGRIEPTSQQFVPGGVDVTYDLSEAVPPGKYHLVAYDLFDPSCLEVPDVPDAQFWPLGCPVVQDPIPGPTPQATLDGGVQNIVYGGGNLTVTAVPRFIHQDTGVEMKNVSVDSTTPTTITIGVDPTTTAPADPTGLYDLELTPTDPDCPPQRVLGAVNVNP